MPSVTDASHFPSLGAPVKVATGPVAWGPSVVTANIAALGEEQVRAGSTELFDSSHPRNTFAKKPKSSGDGKHELAVDWTAAGTTGVHHHLVTVGANPAHLAPHQLATQMAQPSHQPRPAMSTAYPVQQFVQAPTIQQYVNQPQYLKHVQQQPQMHVRRPMVTQARGR